MYIYIYDISAQLGSGAPVVRSQELFWCQPLRFLEPPNPSVTALASSPGSGGFPLFPSSVSLHLLFGSWTLLAPQWQPSSPANGVCADTLTINSSYHYVMSHIRKRTYPCKLKEIAVFSSFSENCLINIDLRMRALSCWVSWSPLPPIPPQPRHAIAHIDGYYRATESFWQT